MSTSDNKTKQDATPFPTKQDNPKQRDEAVDEALDKGIEESFPASDPVSITTEKPDDKTA